jgi:hypothetical protein
MCDIHGVVPFFPNRGGTVSSSCHRVLWGVTPGAVVVLVNPLDRARGVSLPCGISRRRGNCCRGVQCTVLMGRGVEGAADGGLALVKGRTASEGRCLCLPRTLHRREVQGVGGTVAGRCQTCPQSVPLFHTVPGIAA